MTKKDFSFTDRSTWTKDYEALFNDFKRALAQSMVIHFPNYELDFVLRTDASLVGCGGLLVQRKPLSDGLFQDILIAIISHKFTEQASRWTTYEQHMLYSTVSKKMSYYLYCNPFIVETDHNNLRWMDTSLVPKVMRWRAYLSSFIFLIRHIPGTQNGFADWLSRMHAPTPSPIESLSALAVATSDPTFMCHQAHDGRVGPPGSRRTWANLSKLFPGHRLQFKFVDNFVASCPFQLRLSMTNNFRSLVLNNKVASTNHTIGIDTVTIIPADRNGIVYVFVIANFFTNHVFGYASATNPGSEFTKDMMKHLNSYLGLNHQLTLAQTLRS